MDIFQLRLQRLQKKIARRQAFLLGSPTDVRYFTDFIQLTPEREAFLIICPQQVYLIHSSFSPTPDSNSLIKLAGCDQKTMIKHLEFIINQEKLNTLSLDEENISVAEYRQIKTLNKIQLVTLNKKEIWMLRILKDDQEIKNMQQAASIAKKALVKTIKQLKIGQTEKEVCQNLENHLRQLGAEEMAFPTIVAFGQNSAQPHHQPTTSKLKTNQVVLIDCGAVYHGYCSDLTRTVWFGQKAEPFFQKIKTVVDTAYHQAKSLLQKQNQLQANDLDQAARQYIKAQGYENEFIHTTGHGLGLDIHEPPSLSWRNEQEIKNKMVFTIEPGIYLPKKFGYRYENTISYRQNHCQELTI